MPFHGHLPRVLAWHLEPLYTTYVSKVRAMPIAHVSPQPKYPTYPNALSPSQTSAGLAAPAAAVVVMGKGGAVAILLVVLYVLGATLITWLVMTSPL